MDAGLRERKKARTREALVAAAWKLFSRSGYDAVTVDEIAAAAEVSRSTFFRYFGNKEDVVFPFQHIRLARFEQRLSEADPEARMLDAIWGACRDLADQMETHRAQAVAQYRLIRSSPQLIAADRAYDHQWEQAISEYFQRRGVDAADARVLGATVFGVLRVTLREWAEAGGQESLGTIGGESFELLREGLRLRS